MSVAKNSLFEGRDNLRIQHLRGGFFRSSAAERGQNDIADVDADAGAKLTKFNSNSIRSFAMMLVEMCQVGTLEKLCRDAVLAKFPTIANFSTSRYKILNMLNNNQIKPLIPANCDVPEKIRALIEECWAGKIEGRPTFMAIVKRLNEEIMGDMFELEDITASKVDYKMMRDGESLTDEESRSLRENQAQTQAKAKANMEKLKMLQEERMLKFKQGVKRNSVVELQIGGGLVGLGLGLGLGRGDKTGGDDGGGEENVGALERELKGLRRKVAVMEMRLNAAKKGDEENMKGLGLLNITVKNRNDAVDHVGLEKVQAAEKAAGLGIVGECIN